MKTVYLFIGPKGSGKSYVGKLIERELGIEFLNVEDFFIELIKNPDEFDEKENIRVWDKIEKTIRLKFEKIGKLSLESIGSFNSFKNFLKKLQVKYSVKLIKIETPLNLCFQRIALRNEKRQLAMSKDKIELINKMSLKEFYDFDLILDNKNLSDGEIIEKIRKIIY